MTPRERIQCASCGAEAFTAEGEVHTCPAAPHVPFCRTFKPRAALREGYEIHCGPDSEQRYHYIKFWYDEAIGVKRSQEFFATQPWGDPLWKAAKIAFITPRWQGAPALAPTTPSPRAMIYMNGRVYFKSDDDDFSSTDVVSPAVPPAPTPTPPPAPPVTLAPAAPWLWWSNGGDIIWTWLLSRLLF